jgi:hypothetical protein
VVGATALGTLEVGHTQEIHVTYTSTALALDGGRLAVFGVAVTVLPALDAVVAVELLLNGLGVEHGVGSGQVR